MLLDYYFLVRDRAVNVVSESRARCVGVFPCFLERLLVRLLACLLERVDSTKITYVHSIYRLSLDGKCSGRLSLASA